MITKIGIDSAEGESALRVVQGLLDLVLALKLVLDLCRKASLTPSMRRETSRQSDWSQRTAEVTSLSGAVWVTEKGQLLLQTAHTKGQVTRRQDEEDNKQGEELEQLVLHLAQLRQQL